MYRAPESAGAAARIHRELTSARPIGPTPADTEMVVPQLASFSGRQGALSQASAYSNARLLQEGRESWLLIPML
ncbi:MAG: hypothetical protein ACI841_001736 [Planctomycetota bacterium]|jgi:hypothetical protein